jgi:hemerythrin
MALVTWDQSYSVRVRKLDEQHQKLFSLLNALHEAMRQGKGQAVVQDTLGELATDAVTHFRAEEELLRRTNYPGFAAHQAEHQKFVEKVNQFIGDLKAGRNALPI